MEAVKGVAQPVQGHVLMVVKDVQQLVLAVVVTMLAVVQAKTNINLSSHQNGRLYDIIVAKFFHFDVFWQAGQKVG